MRRVTLELTEAEAADLREHLSAMSCAAGTLAAVTAKLDAAPALCAACLEEGRQNADPEDAHHMTVEACNAGLPDGAQTCGDPGYHHPFKP